MRGGRTKIGRRPGVVGSGWQQPASGRETDDHEDERSDPEVRARFDRECSCDRAEAGACESAGAERSMERREDRAAVPPLERETLRVRGHVDRAEARSESEQRHDEASEAAGKRGEEEEALPATSAATVTRRLPTRGVSQPATGMATSAPSDIPKSARPSCGFVSPVSSCTAGIRAAHVPISRPSAKKKSVIVARVQRIRRAPPRCPPRGTRRAGPARPSARSRDASAPRAAR